MDGGQARNDLATLETSRAARPDEMADVLGVGSVVGRYLVVERLGAGAMGVVYAAYDPQLDRKIALKLLRPRPGGGDEALRQERLVREAKAIAKLSHPNIVHVYDVGIHDGNVFLAMEYLGGGTLKRWVTAERRTWREVVKAFVEVGRGLAAAHAAGLIHRDFKPENVLVDRNGVPKVVDFGLVRLMDSFDGGPEEAGGVTQSAEIEPDESISAGGTALTRTGALMGTPGYMAPEQFLLGPVDARTDQFAFCVSLYQALYGQRPFAGDSVAALQEAVTGGQVAAVPEGSAVPAWVRRVILRGLSAEPAERYPGMGELLAALASDPVARRRRWLGIGAGVVAALAVVVGVQRRYERRNADFERQIGARLAEGDGAFAEAVALKKRLQELRTRSFALFDSHDREAGERVWSEARAASASLDGALARAQRALEAGLAMDQGRAEARKRLGEVLFERAALAELELRREDLARHLAALESVDGSGEQMKRWRQPGSLSVRTVPSGARVTIERYDSGDGGRMALVPLGEAQASPLAGHRLSPGSYRLSIETSGHTRTLYPFVMKRGEPLSLEVVLPTHNDIPEGFVYVPAGRFLYGDHDEDLRVAFLNAGPLHEQNTGDFLISTHETTFAEWIAFLASLPLQERPKRMPNSSALYGNVALWQTRRGDWRLRLNISGHQIESSSGEKLVYPARSPLSANQDWLRMPVVGVSVRDMQAYVAWLSTTRRVRNARLCTEAEWERAARGADERVYPSSLLHLMPGDANVDETYGRVSGAYGPDEVGSHPHSRSPFGIDDLAGNVWEVVRRHGEADSFVIRSGSYYQRFQDARSTNREPFELGARHHLVGIRVCADWSAEIGGRPIP